MRCDQFAGLPPEALVFLAKNEMPGTKCPTCGHDPGPKLTKCGSYSGMFDDDDYDLFRHELQDGRHANEFLQAAPWSSGRVHFLGLRVRTAVGALHSYYDITWSQEAIDKV
jgi:hypothetical protein